jgi:hypothetical protein
MNAKAVRLSKYDRFFPNHFQLIDRPAVRYCSLTAALQNDPAENKDCYMSRLERNTMEHIQTALHCLPLRAVESVNIYFNPFVCPTDSALSAQPTPLEKEEVAI